MKNLTKKLFSVLLALTLVLSFSVTAFAADDDTYTLTITGQSTNTNSTTLSDNHTFSVYQIFTGVISGSEGSYVLSDIVWGNGITDAGKTALYEKYGLTGDDQTAAKVAEAIVTANDAQALAEALTATDTSYLQNATEVTADSNGEYSTSVAAGYYLVLDALTDSTDNENEFISNYMVEVVGATTMEVKGDIPTSDKQVWDEVADAEAGSTDGWGETADHAIGETFQFKLIASIPADVNVSDYETYMLIFNDTISKGITFYGIDSVTISDGSTTSTLTSSQYTLSTNVASATAESGVEGPVTWTLTISDIKTLDTSLDRTNALTVTVIYNAELNDDAVVGNEDDNNNTFYLTYSNNPNASAAGASETGDTPEDTVYVFTYEVNGYKYDDTTIYTEATDLTEFAEGVTYYTYNEDTETYSVTTDTTPQTGTTYYTASSTPLSGAEFIFYYTDENGATQYYAGTDDDGIPTWTTDKDSAETLTSGNDGTFKIVSGLDTGTYYLEETQAPTGYNSLSVPITIVISATHSEDENGQTASTSITYTVDDEEQTSSTVSVLNSAGSLLPTTGGMGTTILYTIGIILVLGAGVLLIVRRRMSVSK